MAETDLPTLNISTRTAEDRDEPLTPVGRLFLRPELDGIINCVIGVENDVTVETIKLALQESLLVEHPRFASLVVRHGSMEYWRKTKVDVDRHVVVVNSFDPTEDVDGGINEYIGRLSVSAPLSLDKPLWEVHVMPTFRCAVFRCHHALGDGTSLMALLLAGCHQVSLQRSQQLPAAKIYDGWRKKKDVWRLLCLPVTSAWRNLRCLVGMSLNACFVFNRRKVLAGGKAIRLMPRKVATAKFLIENMTIVKEAISNATINDVLLGIISAGLSEYFHQRSEKGFEEGTQLTAMSAVNLRKQGGMLELSTMMNGDPGTRWGNVIGSVLLPVKCFKESDDPLDYLRKVKVVADAKKRSIEAHFMYMMGNLLTAVFGPEVAFSFYRRYVCNSSFLISNLMGPKEELTILGNPIKFMRINTTGFVQPLTMHFLSYAGRAEMQITVAEDIIPDPQLLADCFEHSLLDMKEAALALAKKS